MGRHAGPLQDHAGLLQLGGAHTGGGEVRFGPQQRRALLPDQRREIRPLRRRRVAQHPPHARRRRALHRPRERRLDHPERPPAGGARRGQPAADHLRFCAPPPRRQPGV